MSSPYINRFLQPDTLIPDLSSSQGWNRYSYVLNNPILHNDPTGHCVAICIAIVLIGLAVAVSQIPSDVPQDNPANQGDPSVMASGLFLAVGAPELSAMVGEGLMGVGNILNSPRIFGAGVSAYNAATATTNTSFVINQRQSLTEDEFWQKRHQYTNEVLAIPRRASDKMNYDGLSEYDAANWAAEERLAIGKNYKNLMPPSMQEQVFNRNLNIKKYPSMYGPDADWLRTNKGYSNAQIIKSAGRPDGGDIIRDLLDYFDDIWK